MTNFVDILECADKDIALWDHQKNFLSWYQANYNKYDFFVCQVPVGGGKSRIATAVSTWHDANGLGKTTIICMTKMLQDQYGDTFQWLPTLKGADNYRCHEFGSATQAGTCGNTRRHAKKYCEGGCAYRSAKDRAVAASTAILNPWNYEALADPENGVDFYRANIIVDEAHGLVGYLFGSCEYKIWRHITSWKDTDDLTKNEVIIEILQRELSRQAHLKAEGEMTSNSAQIKECEEEIEKLNRAIGALSNLGNDVLISVKEEIYLSNKADDENNHQLRQVIHIKPKHVDKIASRLWPDQVRKVLFMSATIGPEIIKEFGIDPARVGYFECDSPIPKANRRCIYWPVADMSFRKRQASMETIIGAILKTANRFPDQKGFIHATYDVAKKLKNSLSGNPRFIFHDKYSKKDDYRRFRDSKQPLIMVGSGMSEGIDLAGDAARWQIITVVQYPSLADDVNKWRMQNEKHKWLAETCRTIQQQYGRVCRGPNDHGMTIILDQQFWNLLKQTKGLNIWPKWFMEALEMPQG